MAVQQVPQMASWRMAGGKAMQCIHKALGCKLQAFMPGEGMATRTPASSASFWLVLLVPVQSLFMSCK